MTRRSTGWSAQKRPIRATGKSPTNLPSDRALMGKRVGDIVMIETPGGQMQMKILKIE